MPRVYYQHEMEFAATTFRNHPVYIQPSPTTTTGHQHHHQTVLQRLGLESQLLTSTAVHLQQYLRYSEPLELTAAYPLDLSLKSQGPITPPCTPSPGIKRNQSPTIEATTKKKQSSASSNNNHNNNNNNSNTPRKTKAIRKLNFDEDNSSPVSGTIIRELRPDENLVVRKGDIDPAFNVVEITEEAKAELAKIENHIGDYVCRLCKELYEDAFGLAQHRCSRIVHVEYRCPECDKIFNCPANLASHRRWHKPRPIKDNNNHKQDDEDKEHDNGGGENVEQFPCGECGKKFRRIAYLRKHQNVHQIE